MRSQLVTSALKHIPNRYLLTRITARAIRGFHRPNTRIAETANEVLLRSGTKNPIAVLPNYFRKPDLRHSSRLLR